MDIENGAAGNPAPQNAGAGQEPAGVSNPTNPASSPSDSPASTENGGAEEKATVDQPGDKEGQAPDNEESEDKQTPYHQSKAFQRQQRRIRKLKESNAAAEKTLAEVLPLLKQIAAKQEGKEYTPEQPANTEKSQDYQDVFDMEIEALAGKEQLSDAVQDEIEKLAWEFGADLGEGKKMPMSAEQAYALYKRMNPSGATQQPAGNKDDNPESKPAKKPTPGPGKKTRDEGKVQPNGPQKNLSLHQLVAQAKMEAQRLRL